MTTFLMIFFWRFEQLKHFSKISEDSPKAAWIPQHFPKISIFKLYLYTCNMITKSIGYHTWGRERLLWFPSVRQPSSLEAPRHLIRNGSTCLPCFPAPLLPCLSTSYPVSGTLLVGMIGEQRRTSDKQGLVEKEAPIFYQTPFVARPTLLSNHPQWQSAWDRLPHCTTSSLSCFHAFIFLHFPSSLPPLLPASLLPHFPASLIFCFGGLASSLLSFPILYCFPSFLFPSFLLPCIPASPSSSFSLFPAFPLPCFPSFLLSLCYSFNITLFATWE